MSDSDIVALNQLAFRYAAAVDACDVQGLLAVFTPDGRVRSYHPEAEEPFADLSGPAIAAIPDAMRGMYRATAHMMTNHLVQVQGETATGTVLCTARHLSLKPEDTALTVMIRYHDCYAKLGCAWRIADRQIRFLWTELHGVSEKSF